MPDETNLEVPGAEVESEELAEGRQIVRTVAENFAIYYANNSEVGMTTWDLSIRFARIEGANDKSLLLQDQAVITMSLHHAKALAMILGSYIKQYEKDNGKLSVPFGAVQAGESQEQKIPTSMFEPRKKEQ